MEAHNLENIPNFCPMILKDGSPCMDTKKVLEDLREVGADVSIYPKRYLRFVCEMSMEGRITKEEWQDFIKEIFTARDRGVKVITDIDDYPDEEIVSTIYSLNSEERQDFGEFLERNLPPPPPDTRKRNKNGKLIGKRPEKPKQIELTQELMRKFIKEHQDTLLVDLQIDGDSQSGKMKIRGRTNKSP
jgi:hypothetical protein